MRTLTQIKYFLCGMELNVFSTWTSAASPGPAPSLSEALRFSS